MNTSLFVAKANGEREVLDNVRAAKVCEIFAGTDWDQELAAAAAAQAAGQETTYIPEIGLQDDEERGLVITPIDSGTVSISVEFPSLYAGLGPFPKSEVAGLVDLYFSKDDDAIAAIVKRYTPDSEIVVHEITDDEFPATLAGPMHRLGFRERPVQVSLDDYFERLALPISQLLEMTDIYLAADKQYSHFLFNYGDPATFLVIVVRDDPGQGVSLIGHRYVNTIEHRYPA